MSENDLVLLPEVVKRTRLSATTLWRLEKIGKFPRRLKISVKRVAWKSADIDAYISACADAATKAAA